MTGDELRLRTLCSALLLICDASILAQRLELGVELLTARQTPIGRRMPCKAPRA
jgi:hypothetical protein